MLLLEAVLLLRVILLQLGQRPKNFLKCYVILLVYNISCSRSPAALGETAGDLVKV